jgi:hypothetical protein
MILSHDPENAIEAAAAVLGVDRKRYARLGKLTDEQLQEAAITDAAQAAADDVKAKRRSGADALGPG